MKFIAVGIFLMCFKTLFAQVPKSINYYLTHKDVSKTAKDFYNGKFKASDDGKTFSIIDSLKTKNNLTRPFYILLVCKMMKHSDGALSEALDVACQDFVESNPNDITEFLYSSNQFVSKEDISNWAQHLAWSIENCEGKERICLKTSFDKASMKIKTSNISRLKQFYNLIESKINADLN